MQLHIHDDLTKKYILEHISQEEIMERYLGIPVVFDVLVTAPPIIRQDNSPTCSFYYNMHGRLRFRDFSGAFWGDCFDVVAKAINVNVNSKQGFQIVLHTIAKDFKIHKYVDNKEVANYNNIINNYRKTAKPKNKTIFKIIFRNFNYHDDSYWNKFNINRNLLNIGRVYAAEEIYVSKDNRDFILLYRYKTKDPAYCYYGGKTDNIDNWKIYYPLRNRNEVRFHTNSSFLQGKHLITSDSFCIITKSYKDVLSFRSFGIQSVAPPAESVLISNDDYFFLKSRFDFIIGCMDYDNAGIRMMKKMWKTYRIQPIMFTNGTNNTKNYQVKDFAEYVNKYGVEDTKKLITDIYFKYKQDIEKLNKYYYKSLKFLK